MNEHQANSLIGVLAIIAVILAIIAGIEFVGVVFS